MLDGRARKIIDPALSAIAERLKRARIHPDHVTLAGFAIGILAALAIAFHWPTAWTDHLQKSPKAQISAAISISFWISLFMAPFRSASFWLTRPTMLLLVLC
jgi:hypothetical protein